MTLYCLSMLAIVGVRTTTTALPLTPALRIRKLWSSLFIKLQAKQTYCSPLQLTKISVLRLTELPSSAEAEVILHLLIFIPFLNRCIRIFRKVEGHKRITVSEVEKNRNEFVKQLKKIH